jgi:hypothetical protein
MHNLLLYDVLLFKKLYQPAFLLHICGGALLLTYICFLYEYRHDATE